MRFAPDSPSDGEFELEVDRIATTFGAELADLIGRAAGKSIAVTARAAYEGDPSAKDYKKALSEQRALALKKAIERVQASKGGPSVSVAAQGLGFEDARTAFDSARAAYVPDVFDNATAAVQAPGVAPGASVTVLRPAAVKVPIVIPTERGPAPLEPERPSFFRKIALRVRLERNKLVSGGRS